MSYASAISVQSAGEREGLHIKSLKILKMLIYRNNHLSIRGAVQLWFLSGSHIYPFISQFISSIRAKVRQVRT